MTWSAARSERSHEPGRNSSPARRRHTRCAVVGAHCIFGPTDPHRNRNRSSHCSSQWRRNDLSRRLGDDQRRTHRYGTVYGHVVGWRRAERRYDFFCASKRFAGCGHDVHGHIGCRRVLFRNIDWNRCCDSQRPRFLCATAGSDDPQAHIDDADRVAGRNIAIHLSMVRRSGR